ncbi:MAG TPA: hypothetical protein VGD42_00335 [Lysobacter sp.]
MKVHAIYGTVVFLLLAAAGCLGYAAIDTAVTLSYSDQVTYEERQARLQLMSALPALASGKEKAEIVAALERAGSVSAFEKDGCTCVGWVGLKFSADQRLIGASPTRSGQGDDPCDPSP